MAGSRLRTPKLGVRMVQISRRWFNRTVRERVLKPFKDTQLYNPSESSGRSKLFKVILKDVGIQAGEAI